MAFVRPQDDVWAWTANSVHGAGCGKKRTFALLAFEKEKFVDCLKRSNSSPSTGPGSPTRKVGFPARSEICTRSMKRKLRFSKDNNKIMRTCSAPANFIFHPIRDIPARRIYQSTALQVLSWNIASPSNNPFEYWVTHELSDYDEVMKTVQSIIDNAEDRSSSVRNIFTEQMFSELRAELERRGVTDLDILDEIWSKDVSLRRAIPGFLEDHSIGEKRLISMPDRITNSVQVFANSALFHHKFSDHFLRICPSYSV